MGGGGIPLGGEGGGAGNAERRTIYIGTMSGFDSDTQGSLCGLYGDYTGVI